MNIVALLRALLEGVAAYYKTAAVRERAALRRELQTLRHEIIAAADAGDSTRLGELQNQYADASADYEALRAPARHDSPQGD